MYTFSETFGASEIMMSGLRSGFLDATVTACDGAGNCYIQQSRACSGYGGRMSGLVKTEPIEDVINGIQKFGGSVLILKLGTDNTVDPVGGIKKAAELGYKKIAVTTADSNTAKKLRNSKLNLVLTLSSLLYMLPASAKKKLNIFLKIQI